MYYSASAFLCAPNGLSQPGGYALGAQARVAATRQITTDAGFTRFRRAAETPSTSSMKHAHRSGDDSTARSRDTNG